MDAVVLAAGEGTRLRPLTSTRPKPMLPVAGKPILEWNLEALDCVGVKKAVIVVGYMREAIESYFGRKFRKVRLEYVEQKEQLGTANALSSARGMVKGEFIVLNGDLFITRKVLSSLIEAHGRHGAEVTMSLVEVREPRSFGIVEVSRGKVESLVEKPKRPKSNLANAGVYIFKEGIFEVIEGLKKSVRMEYELTDAIGRLIKDGVVYGCRNEEGQWIDVGLPWNLLDANEIVMKSVPLKMSKKATVEDYAVLKGSVNVGDGTVIRSGSYIEGPVYIGRDCVIGPNCYIRPHTVIMDGCKVGNAVEVKNSIIMPRTCVGHLSYVGDSIIGEGCNFGAGTKVANLRFDDGEVSIEVKQNMVMSGRRKFGVLMGDNVKTGINVSIMPGRSIYPNAYVDAGSVVKNTIYTE
ncbi:MAG: NTP transferase domain-containing protein [Candidatus Altiarchaeales archaeon]|nr:NTP transferase domain-containing protein [Candidatus Altiarchaeales archaeon]MBD3416054.1 NTP transferase domain-containing protein [Candidatus Altiarchaeales archaeon]